MKQPALRRLAAVGVACLALLPSSRAFSASLREEAVGYRTEGYERQRQGDLAAAMAGYQKAAAMDPTYATPHNDMGILYEQMGQLEQAEAAYEQTLAIDPNYLGAHANLAMLYERMGDRDKAIVHWLKRRELGQPSDPWTARAEERLVALGAMASYPGLKGKIYSRRQVVQQELEAHEQSLEEFRALTEQTKRWP